MHYHLEIIMPPVEDVNAAVEQILAPFDENGRSDDGDPPSKHAFWDWWQLGGRWSGSKMMHLLGGADGVRMANFREALAENKVTVSGLVWGKQTLQPSSQSDLVDALWDQHFPDAPVKVCPIFDNYKGTAGDVMRLGDCADDTGCSHAIVACVRFDGVGLVAETMLCSQIWNGVTWQQTAWDGTVGSIVAEHRKRLSHCNPRWTEQRTPTDDWLVVTVDYHN